jgi:diguanylate cyclase (GGDEF)-like protein
MREDDIGPFARPGLARRAGPFAIAMVVALTTVPLSDRDLRPLPAVAAALLTVAIGAAAWFVPWTRLPSWTQALPPLAWFAVAELMRQSTGGSTTGYASLVFLPVLWLMLYGTGRQAAVAIAVLSASLVAPVVADGRVTGAEIRVLVLRTVVVALVSVTFVRLVRAVRRQAAELERLASTDALTGLPNRRLWDESLPRELARAIRVGAPVAIALLDLDDFKRLNDEHGHHRGDRVLKETAARWRAELRDSDLLARHGGEEFALLLPDCGAADVLDVVEKVRTAMPGGITSSAGIAIWDGIEAPADLIRRADEALYQAKRAGRDRTVVAAGMVAPAR